MSNTSIPVQKDSALPFTELPEGDKGADVSAVDACNNQHEYSDLC